MKLSKTKLLKDFLTDDQILEVLSLFEESKMEASKLLAAYMFPKWQMSTLEAYQMILNVYKEWQTQ